MTEAGSGPGSSPRPRRTGTETKEYQVASNDEVQVPGAGPSNATGSGRPPPNFPLQVPPSERLGKLPGAAGKSSETVAGDQAKAGDQPSTGDQLTSGDQSGGTGTGTAPYQLAAKSPPLFPIGRPATAEPQATADEGVQNRLSDRPDVRSGPRTPRVVATTMSDHQLVSAIQRTLVRLGYEPGPVDGVHGPNTMRAIEEFERDNGLPLSGMATEEVLRAMQMEVIGSRVAPDSRGPEPQATATVEETGSAEERI